jgi:hypothetical protein
MLLYGVGLSIRSQEPTLTLFTSAAKFIVRTGRLNYSKVKKIFTAPAKAGSKLYGPFKTSFSRRQGWNWLLDSVTALLSRKKWNMCLRHSFFEFALIIPCIVL